MSENRATAGPLDDAGGAGLVVQHEGSITVTLAHPGFEHWWEPYTLGVGPAGDHVTSLDPATREALRERCRALLPPAPFEVSATAWAVRASV